MKRTIIQASLFILFVSAIAGSLNAQSPQKYRAEIPFNFEVNGKQYTAGRYTLGPITDSARSAIVLHGLEKGMTSGILKQVAQPGNNNWDLPGTMSFLKVDGKYRLVQIATATFKMKLKAPESVGERIAGAGSNESKTVSINLHK